MEKTEIYSKTLKEFKILAGLIKNEKSELDQSVLIYNSLREMIYYVFYHKFNKQHSKYFESLDDNFYNHNHTDNFNMTISNITITDNNGKPNVTYSNTNMEQFVTGIFEGISRVDFEDNKCYHKDIKRYIPEIILRFNSIVDAFKFKENISNSINDLYNYIVKLKLLGYNCNFAEMTTEIHIFSYLMGESNFVYRLLSNRKEISEYYQQFVESIVNDNYNQAGIAFGNISKLLTMHSTR